MREAVHEAGHRWTRTTVVDEMTIDHDREVGCVAAAGTDVIRVRVAQLVGVDLLSDPMTVQPYPVRITVGDQYELNAAQVRRLAQVLEDAARFAQAVATRGSRPQWDKTEIVDRGIVDRDRTFGAVAGAGSDVVQVRVAQLITLAPHHVRRSPFAVRASTPRILVGHMCEVNAAQAQDLIRLLLEAAAFAETVNPVPTTHEKARADQPPTRMQEPWQPVLSSAEPPR